MREHRLEVEVASGSETQNFSYVYKSNKRDGCGKLQGN